MARRAAYQKPKTSSPAYFKWTFIIGGIALVILTLWLLQRRYHFFHPDIILGKQYTVLGIDVSKHNGDIDFEKVAGEGYSFVFIKASEGATYKDPNFDRNYIAARKAGLKVGAYHFFRKNREGAAQARNFMRSVSGVQLDMPLVVDIEDWSNDYLVSKADTRKRLVEMVKTLKSSRRRIIIYTNGNGYDEYYKPNFADDELWLCSFNEPDSIKNTGHIFQQYSHWGRVKGIKGDVDLNVFMGSKLKWRQWLDDVDDN